MDADPIDTASVELDPFDRMVLTADGTVTTLLEACAGEPVVTRTTRQSGTATLDALRAAIGCWWQTDARLLRLEPAERLLARCVTLRGGLTGVVYGLAESLIVPDRLPDWFADRLVRAGASLGRLLAAGQLDTRREIESIVAERAGAAADHLAVEPASTLLRRTYTILIGQRPVAAVTEWLVPGRLGTSTQQPSVSLALHPPRVGRSPEFVADL